MINTLLFDFDGTIADTLEEAVHLYNGFAKQYGFNLITEENLPKIRAMGPREVAKALNVSIFQIAFVFTKLRAGIRDKIETMKVYPGIRDTLEEIKNLGYTVAVVSSNSTENIRKFLDNNDLIRYIDFVHSGSSVLGKHRVLNDFIAQKGWNKENLVYIGDEKRDIDAARKSKIKIIAVAWGANLKSSLQESEPDFLIDEPNEIIGILKNENEGTTI